MTIPPIFGSGLVDCLMVIALLLAALTAVLWRQVRSVRSDRDRLCIALERIESGDYSDDTLDLQSSALDMVSAAYGRMVPNIRSTFEELEWNACHDALTSTLNANNFKRQCVASLNMALDNSLGGGAMLFVDINDFKTINDNLGHEAGDRFLVTCADRVRLACATFKSGKMAALVAGADLSNFDPVIGRLGGDEFGIFLPGNPDRGDVEKFVAKLQRLIAEPCQIGSHSLNAKISIGIAFSADHHNAYDKLLAGADTAMYEAKSLIGSGYRFYDEAMRNKADLILDRELEIRQAIQQSQFTLHFQPQINLATNQIEGTEALIRWNHPTRGLVGPNEFIPFAETYNLIDDLGDWVLTEAIATAARWRKQGRNIRISVNISPKQLSRVELIPLIRALLDFHKLPAEALEIEITEAALMRCEEVTRERIEGLRRDGVTIALDDFGTGYSNLAQLLALPLDRIKLDRSLLTNSSFQRRTRLVVLSIIQLARKLGINVVAEGVENEEQLRFLQHINCHFVQGFLFSPPLTETEFLELCANHEAAHTKAVTA
ncbi:MAG: bifunctional diguanylate cyclase/phosphodiesterase [Proteobacteria bacterium]|nr:bifunctional diguanylate cyclase/phosphodiesterase [Pseudomonadota bacterium]